jgi:hypothetical protein
MHEIKSFSVWQTSRVVAVLQGTLEWIEGVLAALASLAHGHPLQAIFFIIGFPIVVAVLGFIVTAFFCWLYNQVAARFGGIAIELTPRIEP